MIVTGIIVEYNPLHNGHIKHIEYAREQTKCDVLIAVMSGNFVQRGEPAITDKFSRTKEALKENVDLVIELPFVYVNQNASVFAKSAVDILKLAQCDYIVFGSEINDLNVLKTYSELNINVDNLKETMSDGTSYPKAYSILSQSFYPNDILGVAYLKALKGSSLKPLIIKRDNEHEHLNINSASSIRNLVRNHDDFKKFTPMKSIHENPVFIEHYFDLMKTILLTQSEENLHTIALFAEGIENNLKKQIANTYDYHEFIEKSISRRYTKARINRTLMFMLAGITQKEIDTLPKISELRILGFNTNGQKYMRYLSDQGVKVVSKFKHLNKTYRDLELRSTAVYISTLPKEKQKYLWNKEFRGPIIYKDETFHNE